MKSIKQKFDYECAIVGAGPGGLVAAIYLERYKRKIVLIDSQDSRARWAPRIRNLVGYSNGISGANLLKLLMKQIAHYQPEFKIGEASVRRKNGGFEISVGNEIFTAATVILAIGMKDAQPKLPNVPELRRKGLLAYCPICDGYDHSRDKVGLLVQNNHGLKKVKFLAKFSPQLYVFQTIPFRIAPQFLEQMKELNVRLYEGTVMSMRAEKGLHVKMDTGREVKIDLAYVGLGSSLNKTAFKNLRNLRRTKEGFIVTSSHQETSIRRLYAVGDCVQALSQVSVAIGHAAIAATNIHNDLLKDDTRVLSKTKKLYVFRSRLSTPLVQDHP